MPRSPYGSKAKLAQSATVTAATIYGALKALTQTGDYALSHAWAKRAVQRGVFRPRHQGLTNRQLTHWANFMGTILLHLGLVNKRLIRLTSGGYMEYTITTQGETWLREYEECHV